MKTIDFDFENVGGVYSCYAIPHSKFYGCEMNYAEEIGKKYTVDGSCIVEIPMYADGSFVFDEKESHADGGAYWDVDVSGVIPKMYEGNAKLVRTLERGRWVVLSLDNNGIIHLSGSEEVPLFFETEKTSGAAYAERNGIRFHFKGKQPDASVILQENDIEIL